MKRLRLVLRLMLLGAALWGMLRAVGSSNQLRAVKAEYQRLAREIGSLPVEDPSKVYIVGLPTPERLAWRFRVYVPAHQSFATSSMLGQISSTSPRRGNASGGWSSSGSNNDSRQSIVTVAFIKEATGWMLHTNGISGRGMGGVDHRLAELLDQNAPLVVEAVGQEGPVSLDVDEPICLLRVRGTEPVSQPDSNDPLYLGFYWYLLPESVLETFEAEQTGREPVTSKVP